MTDHPEGLDMEEVRRDLTLYTTDLLHVDTEPDQSARCRLLMSVPMLVNRVDRLTQECDLLREKVRLMEESIDIDHLTRAIADPGSVVDREGRDSDWPESVPRWSARAALRAIQTRWRAGDAGERSRQG